MYHTRTLEFHKVLEIVADFAHSKLGREKVLSLFPISQVERIRRWFQEVEEAVLYLQVEQDISFSELEDIGEYLNVARVEGAVLTADKLLKVRRQLLVASSVRDRLRVGKYPSLESLADNISPLGELSKALDNALEPSGQVKDGASLELSAVRESIRSLKGEITSRLKKLLSDPSKAGWFSDRNIHIRNDRYVVAVRSERAGHFKGVVVDTSSSGRTVYMEPVHLVPLNNRLAMLREEERREEERILRELTSKVGRHAGALSRNQEVLAYLDSVFARARFALKYWATIPGVGRERRLFIVRGRHPLLCKVKGDGVVPLDVDMGREFTTLVITGPNTGGKTVALKTIGVLTLMALSGIPVTAEADSYFYVFKNVLADIGDEQEIESSLSTFSSHITRIKEILEGADRDSLVLIDELGTGTDPEEGSALAVAIAEYLHKKGSFNVITTHHGDLKVLAHGVPGMENASVEFDTRTLMPTYRLRVGVPGESNAFVIARRLGLPSEVVKRAEEVRGTRETDASRVSSWVMRAREEALRELERARSLREEAERRLEEAKKEAERLKESALNEVMKMVEEARNRVKEASAKGSHHLVRTTREIARRVSERRMEEVRPLIEEGSVVEVPSFGLKGRVLSVKGSRVEVDTGKMKMVVPLASVRPTGEKMKESGDSKRDITITIERSRDTFFPEINLIGKRVDDAIPELERFINDGYLLGMKSLKIVHGKGEGILKRAVHQYLKDHPLVQSYRLADEREGGSGVTLVELE